MHTVLGVIVVSSLAFVGTMIDNFFAFAAQLSLTNRVRFQRVSIAHALGVFSLIVLAGGIGSLLTSIPLRWVGVLCVAPWALGVHAWRQRHSSVSEQYRRGALTTYLLCVALGGDNIAVWIPLLRANGKWHELVAVIVFAIWETLFILGSQKVATHPRVITFGATYGRTLIPWVYAALGVLILIECGTFS
jgi:cadmium resistance protein CadD (predicted permease)